MLEGNLDEFSIPDIFQLLTLTKKSGALRVRSDEREGRVYFKGGEVYFAVADTRRMPLGARLVGAGLVTEEHLRTVLESNQGVGSVGLGQILLEENAIDEGVLDTFVREQIQDAVFELMRLNEGRFKFDAKEDTDEAVGLSLSTEQLLLEGGQRLAEWANIQRHLPTPDVVASMALAPPGNAAMVTLTAEQWRLLSLVDGRRSAGDIAELAGMGEFATAKALAELVDAGLLEVADVASGGTTAVSALVARRDALRRLEELELGAPPAPRAAEPPPAPRAAEPTPAPAAAPSPETPAPAVVPVPETRAPALDHAHVAPAPAAVAAAPALDHADVARELASFGLGPADAAGERQAPPTRDQDAAPTRDQDATPTREQDARLTRDQDVNKALLLRLIDGVKGA